MNLPTYFNYTLILLLHISIGTYATTFTFTNKCGYTVWPGILANAGTPKLETTGFELLTDTTRTLQAPSGWSGRFWARTGCTTNTNLFYCATGDCGSGSVECSGTGAEPPATLAEFTLGSPGNDFYDVSLVDGYNLPMLVEPSGGSGQCASTGCIVDLNQACPVELRAGNGGACKSACEAFGSAEYCCSGAYATPDTCKPTVYSRMFKAACPRCYSYAYDDSSSTFTCAAADGYTITFCPTSPSQKSSRDTTTPVTSPPVTVTAPVTTTSPGFSGSYPLGSTPTQPTGSGLDMTYGSGTPTDGVTGTYTTPGDDDSGTGTGTTTTAMLSDGSWLAGLAMGDSTILQPTLVLALCSTFLAIVLTL